MTAPPVIGDGSRSPRWSQNKAARVKRCPPVIGKVGRRRQRLPRLSEMAPSRWRGQKKAATAAVAPPVVGDGSPSR
jgi:hypothetical protein